MDIELGLANVANDLMDVLRQQVKRQAGSLLAVSLGGSRPLFVISEIDISAGSVVGIAPIVPCRVNAMHHFFEERRAMLVVFLARIDDIVARQRFVGEVYLGAFGAVHFDHYSLSHCRQPPVASLSHVSLLRPA